MHQKMGVKQLADCPRETKENGDKKTKSSATSRNGHIIGAISAIGVLRRGGERDLQESSLQKKKTKKRSCNREETTSEKGKTQIRELIERTPKAKFFFVMERV